MLTRAKDKSSSHVQYQYASSISNWRGEWIHINDGALYISATYKDVKSIGLFQFIYMWSKMLIKWINLSFIYIIYIYYKINQMK